MPLLLLNSYVNNNTNISYDDKDVANFDSNMVIILAALLCALICALVLNSIVRCAVRCTATTWAHHETGDELAVAAGGLSSSGADLKKEALAVVEIPVVVYKSGVCIPAATECTICLGEFVEGENVRILPRCNHGFHVKCIDTWLLLQCSCPICRQPLMECSATSDG